MSCTTKNSEYGTSMILKDHPIPGHEPWTSLRWWLRSDPFRLINLSEAPSGADKAWNCCALKESNEKEIQ